MDDLHRGNTIILVTPGRWPTPRVVPAKDSKIISDVRNGAIGT